MKRIFDFIYMGWLNYKGQFAAFHFGEYMLLNLAYPFMTMIFYCILAKYAYSSENITNWIIGNSFFLCNNICVFTLGACFLGERYFGRIRSIVVGEKSKIQIILEKGVFPCLFGVITTLLGFTVGCLVFGVSLKSIPWSFFLLSILVTMFSFTGFGLLLSVFGLITDSMNLILNLINYLLLIFTGALIPVTQFEYPVRLISDVLPMTRGIAAMRAYIAGNEIIECVSLLGQEACVGIAYFLIAGFIVQLTERIAIRSGRIDMF